MYHFLKKTKVILQSHQSKIQQNLQMPSNTVSSVLEAAACNYFDEILDQILLSKKCVLLRLLFEGGFYLRAASNTEFTVYHKTITLT